ncbi:hypothetical protein ABBQ32_005953 [Trebouxia sp. C0010 RCD-2024]
MSTLCSLASFVGCTSSLPELARRRITPSRCLTHKGPLAVRSTETPAIHAEDYSSGTQNKFDILKNVSQSSRQQLADCEPNAHISEAEMRSLLLRICAFRHLWCQFHSEADPALCDVNNLINKIAVMTQLLAGGSSQHVLQTIERHPPVVAQPVNLLFHRLVCIKQLIPQADVSLVVAKRPSLLCMETEVLAHKLTKAVQQLRALMPAIPWETRLEQDSNLWMTFITLLDDNSLLYPL